jgi:hypothetical protein
MSKFTSLLKKSSDTLDRYSKEIEKTEYSGSSQKQEDDRFWKLDTDKAGNGMAVIRFLPPPEVDGDDGLPWVRIFRYGFKGPNNKWYIENSLSTPRPGYPEGSPDPLGEYNNRLWNSTTDDNAPARKQARNQKRKMIFISNIYVVSDPKHPENEGKVFLFRYGKKIYDKLRASMKPEFEGDVRLDPFHLVEGANFRLRQRKADGYPNYDLSQLEAVSQLHPDTEKMEQIYKSQYSLLDFIDPEEFKNYVELKAKLDAVMGFDTSETRVVAPGTTNVQEWTPPKEIVEPKAEAKTEHRFVEDDDDDDLKEFRKLAEE